MITPIGNLLVAGGGTRNIGVIEPGGTTVARTINGAPSGLSSPQHLAIFPYRWMPTVGGAWGTRGNWQSDELPGAGDDVFFDAPGTYTVALGDDAAVRRLVVRAGQPTLDLGGRTLTLSDDLAVSHYAGDTGSVTVAHGTLVLDASKDHVIGGVGSMTAGLVVDGAAVLFENSDQPAKPIAIGQGGGAFGQVQVLGGGRFEAAADVLVGGGTNGWGNLVVDGEGSRLDAAGELWLGRGLNTAARTSSLGVLNGGRVESTDGYVGANSRNYGQVFIGSGHADGPVSAWEVTDDLHLGGRPDFSNTDLGNDNGWGEVTINAGGVLSVGDRLVLWNEFSNVKLDGGTLRVGTLDFQRNGDSPLRWTAGTLIVTGSTSLPTPVPVGGTLGGNGSLINTVTVEGTLSPGESIGTLGLSNATLRLADGATLLFEFDGASSDLVSGGGAGDAVLILGGGTLALVGSGSAAGDTFQIFTGIETISGVPLLDDWSVTLNGTSVGATFSETEGGIAVMIVPEPGSLAVLGLGLVLLRRP